MDEVTKIHMEEIQDIGVFVEVQIEENGVNTNAKKVTNVTISEKMNGLVIRAIDKICNTVIYFRLFEHSTKKDSARIHAVNKTIIGFIPIDTETVSS